MSFVITIGRQYGSGGRFIARKLAEMLNVSFYDNALLTKAAEESGMSKAILDTYDERKDGFFSGIIPTSFGNDMSIGQKVFLAQFEAIKTIAENENCVIVGRCADYLLKDYNPFRIFVHADIESRINRCSQREKEDENLNKKQLKKKILKIDKNRAKYYSFITGNSWGSKENYDLTINTTDQNIKEIVVAIAKIFE